MRSGIGYSGYMDRGTRHMPPRYRKLIPGDWAERLIVGMLFAVSAVGIYLLTGTVLSSLLIGLLVALVAIGVVSVL
jgi:hypothetical protein